MAGLFCYGILLTGMRYHESHLGGRFANKKAATAKARLLYLPESHAPALVPGENLVKGEYYQVEESIFTKLDYLFGVKDDAEKSEFSRRKIEITTEDGETKEVETYFLRAEVLRKRFPSAYEIKSGDWGEFLGELLDGSN